MGKEGRRFLPNLKKLGSPRLNFDETVSNICKQHISNNSMIKQASIGYFCYLDDDDKIHIPFNIKSFKIDDMKELKTSTFNDIILSKYIQDDSLMIKLVDKDDDIHYYQCNAKFSHWYGELNDKEVYRYLCELLDKLCKIHIGKDIYNDFNIFANALVKELISTFNKNYIIDVEMVDKYVTMDLMINDKDNVLLDIMIETILPLSMCRKIADKYNKTNNAIEATSPYFMMFSREHTSMFGTVACAIVCVDQYAHNIRTEDEVRYIQSAHHLWMPFINKTLDVILNKYNNYAGIMDNVKEVCVNPERSFEDLYTVMKYCGVDIEYTNIL